MKKANIKLIITVFILVAAVLGTLFFSNPFEEGELPSNSDYYTFILEGEKYTLPFKVSDFKENGWSIISDQFADMRLGGHGCKEFEAVKGKNRVGILIGNPTLNTTEINDGNIVGIKFYHGSNTKFLLRDDISYDFTKEQIISTFGLPNSDESPENLKITETLAYSNNEERFDKAEFYFYDYVLGKDKEGLPAVTLYNFGDLVFDISRTNDNDRIEYEEPTELGDDLSAGLFELGGKIYRLPMRYKDFTVDWKLGDWVTSLPSATYCDNFVLRHKKEIIEIDPYLINDTEYVDIIDNASIYGFFTDNIVGWECDLKFPGGLDVSKKEYELEKELSAFEKIGNIYKYEKDGFKLELEYSTFGTLTSLKVSKNADKFESEGRYYLDYGKKEFFDVTKEIKANDKIKPMEKIYVPYYVPKNFSRQSEKYGYKNFTNGIKYASYTNGEEKGKIYFTQEPNVSNRKINLYKKYWTRENGGFYVRDEALQMFFWEKDGYRFAIYTDIEVEREEIYNMANSILTEAEYNAREQEKLAPIRAKIEGKTYEEIEEIYGKSKVMFSGFHAGVYDIDGVEVTIYYGRDGVVSEFNLRD